jgi:tetratricopeptide (TPR) repeat protein
VTPRPGRVLTVARVDPYTVGVSPSTCTALGRRPPYVRRDVDEQVDEALVETSFTLLVGASKAGKSRSAFEAARRAFPHAPFVVPGGSSTITSLPDGGRGPVVVWLDGLDRYLGRLGGVEADLLDLLTGHNHRVVVLATLGSAYHERLLALDGETSRVAQLLVRQATVIHLPVRLSDAERARAAWLYPGKDLAAGIGPTLAGVPTLERRHHGGRRAFPVGWALVQAAADWRRMGITRPVPEQDLRALCAPYLHEMDIDVESADEAFEPGLDWAGRRLGSPSPLLATVGQGPTRSFEAFEYLVAAADGEGGRTPQAIPAATWRTAIASVASDELIGVGFTAYLRAEIDIAEDAWRRALESGHPDAAPWAAVLLGLRHQQAGEVEAAGSAFQRALESGHPEAAPWAASRGLLPEPIAPATQAVGLGLLHEGAGDRQDALATVQQTADSGDPAAPGGALHQGILLERQGDLKAARSAYQRAMSSGHPDAAPAAAANLGALLAERGDVRGARRALRQAMDSGHPDAAPWAAVTLGTLFLNQGRPERAGEAFRWAVGSGHPEQAPTAAVHLGALLAERGDLQGARAALELAVASGHPQHAPRAAVDLGLLLLQQGELDGARAAFQSAVDAGHTDYAPLGLVGLGAVAAARGDLEAAVTVYLRVIDAGSPDAAEVATQHLKAIGDAAVSQVTRRRRFRRSSRSART